MPSLRSVLFTLVLALHDAWERDILLESPTEEHHWVIQSPDHRAWVDPAHSFLWGESSMAN
ncbi:MAG: hypothetical protein IPP83_01435 [Flavobacteriales bacterium]|nr:hypothetical protein [Flavobacteriales bacterium]